MERSVFCIDVMSGLSMALKAVLDLTWLPEESFLASAYEILDHPVSMDLSTTTGFAWPPKLPYSTFHQRLMVER